MAWRFHFPIRNYDFKEQSHHVLRNNASRCLRRTMVRNYVQRDVDNGCLAGTPTSTLPRNTPSTDGGGCRLSSELLNRH